jgi:hypothetical protein
MGGERLIGRARVVDIYWPSEKTNVMSWIFCTGGLLVFRCISEISMLTLLTESSFASAIGSEKKISFMPNPTRTTAIAAMMP